MSITSVYFRPHQWSAAYNPIVWSFISNKYSEIDMSYVVDLYVNGATGPTRTIKQRPNPAGVCMIDVSALMQPYIVMTNYAVENSSWPTEYGNSADFVANVYLKVGEEYTDANGNVIAENGNGSVGAPAFAIYSEEDPVDGPVRVIPAALPWQTGIDTMSSTTDYVFWSDYIMDGNGKFLKQQGNSIDVYSYDNSSLAWLNWWDNGAIFQRSVQLIQIKQYNASGSLLRTDNVQNTTAVGGGPQSNSVYTSQIENLDTDILYFKSGPKNLQDAGIWDNTTAYYTVQAFAKASATSNPAPGAAASELVTYNVLEDCNFLYPRVRVSWLNELGGRDFWNFTMLYEKSTSAPGDEYFQTPLNWSGQRPVAVSGVDANLSVNFMRGGAKSFNKNVFQRFAIQSDWLTQDDVDLLGYISQSPQVWCYVGTDNEPDTVQVVNVDYTYKLVKQVKLVQATLELMYTKVQQKQNM